MYSSLLEQFQQLPQSSDSEHTANSETIVTTEPLLPFASIKTNLSLEERDEAKAVYMTRRRRSEAENCTLDTGVEDLKKKLRRRPFVEITNL
jgi:hypothetical protein